MVLQQLLGLGFVVFGAAFTYGGIKTYRASTQRDTYEPVRATVVTSQLTGPSGGTSAQIEYEYTVGGETYVSDSLYPGPLTSGGGPGSARDQDRIQELVNTYPEGKTVEAYYDPTDPSVSFLINKSRKGNALGSLAVGAFALLFGLAVLVFTPL